MVLLAFAVRHWQHQQMVLGAFGVLTFLVCLTLPESPRWLAQVGKVVAAEEHMVTIARVNNRPLSDEHRNLISTFLRQVSKIVTYRARNTNDVQAKPGRKGEG